MVYEARLHPRACPCGGLADYVFPFQAARNFQPFETYYDEALDIDISGRREKRQILKALDLVEAGDKRGGARDFDEKAPHHIKPLPPRGRTMSDWQREGEAARVAADWTVGSIHSDGTTRRHTLSKVESVKQSTETRTIRQIVGSGD